MPVRPITPPRRAALVALLAFLVVSLGAGMEEGPEREMRIKAGMLLNFIKFTQWPEGAFAKPDSDIEVAVIGEGDIAAAIEDTLRDQRPGDRGLHVRHARVPKAPEEWDSFVAEARKAHVIYFCDSEREGFARVLDALGDAPALTVSDTRDFAARGGMLGLKIAKDRVVFDANPGRIRASGLRVSSQVLRLASTVETRTP
jgi:hypothetical protein